MNPKFNEAGINLMVSLWDGLKQEWAEIQSWFEGVIAQVEAYVARIKAAMAEANAAASGSHADGLAYVPYNGYIAHLHEGERVLTRNEAESYNSGQMSGKGGFVINFFSPKALDPYTSNKKFKQTMREMEEGFR